MKKFKKKETERLKCEGCGALGNQYFLFQISGDSDEHAPLENTVLERKYRVVVKCMAK